MVPSFDAPEHLNTVDAESWPGVATVPASARARVGARIAEARFASVCASAGIELDPSQGATVEVRHDALFRRIAASGWVGLAEGYLAGEFVASGGDALAEVLTGLLGSGFRPKTPAVHPDRTDGAGEVPPALVRHSSGDGMSGFAGHFATGIPTTQRVRVKSYVPHAGRGSQAAYHYVDRTEFTGPLDAVRDDLADAQRRSAEMLLDLAGVGRGTHVVEFPSSGGLVALQAARRGATVDSWVAGEVAERELRDRMVYEGVGGAVHVERFEPAGGQIRGRQGYYDAVVSVERLETLEPRKRAEYLAAIRQLVAPGGRAAVQTVVRTGGFTPAARDATQSLRAYVWPGLNYPTPEGLARAVDRHTQLRIVAETRAPEHLAASLRLQRQVFEGRFREAAADGFDKVYRRLWLWQFALREALARLGMIDLAQVELVPRSRSGRR